MHTLNTDLLTHIPKLFLSYRGKKAIKLNHGRNSTLSAAGANPAVPGLTLKKMLIVLCIMC